tara:strand:- start:86 stop:367 length:282 start_codon:yes stop_codon:yes gene_type:complete
MPIERLDPKTADETLIYSTDFTGELGDDTISTPTAEDVPAALTVSGVASSSGVVSFTVAGGNAGESYAFVVQVTTAASQTLRRTVNLAVVDAR